MVILKWTSEYAKSIDIEFYDNLDMNIKMNLEPKIKAYTQHDNYNTVGLNEHECVPYNFPLTNICTQKSSP